MNIVAGMMMPDTNWAPNEALNSSSFLSSKTFSTSGWRPKTLTRLWPVNASSMCPLSSPVCRHCATNIFCERFAITVVTTIDSGMATRAISARSGEMTIIITSTPTTVSSEVSN